jgi:hypothetical protein
MNLRKRLDRLAKSVGPSLDASDDVPPLPSAAEGARVVCEQLLLDGSAPEGLDVAGVLAALHHDGAELAAEEFLRRACELHCSQALDVEIDYHLRRVGSEVGDELIEEVAQECGLAGCPSWKDRLRF